VDGNKLARTFNDNHVLENHALFTGMELWREAVAYTRPLFSST